jgi:hypothetical protein
MKGKKAFLWKTVAALVILALFAVPVFASFPTYADDGDAGAPAADASAPAAEAPAADAPAADAPAAEAPAAEAPAVDAPVVDAPVADAPVVDAPVADAPVVDAPVVDAPVADAPVVDAPVVDAAAVTTAAITTDKPDYTPSEVPVLSGGGFLPNSQVTLLVTLPDGTKAQLTTQSNESGQFSADFAGGLMSGAYIVSATDGTNTTNTMFLDASLNLIASQDTYVDMQNFATNYNGVTPLIVQDTPAGNGPNQPAQQDKTWLMFDLSTIPAGSTLNGANVYLKEQGGGTSNVPYAYFAPDNWNEATLTWNNAPAYSTSSYETGTELAQSWYSWPVGTYLTTAYNDPANQLFSLVFAYGSPYTGLDQSFHRYTSTDANNADHRPYIMIDYTPPGPANQPPTLTKTLQDTQGHTAPSGNNGWWVYKAVTATLNAADDKGVASIYYYVSTDPTYNNYTVVPNGTPGTTQQYSFTINNEGVNYLGHKAFDTNGVFGSSPVGENQIVKIDTVDPTLTKDLSGTAGNAGWYTGPVQVTLNPYDATSGVAQVQFQIDGGGWQTYSLPFTISADGIAHLDHQVFDVAGNSYVLPAQDVKIDQTDPTLTKLVQLTGLNELTVTLNGTDFTSGVDFIQYSTDGGQTWQTVQCTGGPNGTATFTLTGIGDHELGHLVFDVAGNQYELPDQTVSIAAQGGTMMPINPLVITVDVMGTVASYDVSADGTLLEDALTTSPDGKVSFLIAAGTQVLNPDGITPTYQNIDPDIVFKLAGTPPTPPGYEMVAAYELVPSGVTFSEDSSLIVEYDPDKLPADSTPIIAYYNETAGEWEPLDTAGYVAGGIEQPNTITSHIGHLSYYAVLAKIATAE